MKVYEIFESLQGESSYAGYPCIFVRTTGCNLRCRWCDSEYSYFDGVEYSCDNIAKRINSSKCGIVEFTGGEPLLQKDELIKTAAMINDNKTILVETNGSISLNHLPEKLIKIVDIKLSGSGEKGSFIEDNLSYLSKKDEIKFVLDNISDYNEMRYFYKKYHLGNNCGVLVSKVSGSDLSDRKIAEKILSDGLNVRYQIQLHKYIWKDEKGR
ncbi:MAG: radical SAM protein [Candidatus Delongbacteria bacterium]